MLSIIIPAHNEEENIAEVVSKIEDALSIDFEIIVVNDHSTDATGAIVQGLFSRYSNLKLVDNQLEGGFANAIKSGFLNAAGDMVIPVMGDLCDELSTIPKMLEKMSQGYDVVCGSRYIIDGARIGGSKLKGALSCFAGWSIHFILGVPSHDIANAFKMYRRKVIDSIDIKAKGFEISMEIPLKAYYAGFKITEIPTKWRERTKGKSSFKVLKLLPSYLKFYLWAIAKGWRK